MTTNLYINSVLKPLCKTFSGTFSSDTIPECLKTKDLFSCVINLAEEGEQGTHFVVIIRDRNLCMYIDPLGMACHNDNILRFLEESSAAIKIHSNVAHQSPFSSFCGIYCIFYVILFSYKNFLPFSIQFHKNNLLQNDKVVASYIGKLQKLQVEQTKK